MSSSFPRDLQILAWFGTVILVFLCALPFVIGYAVVKEAQRTTSPPLAKDSYGYEDPIGQAGSRCGGAAKLPCSPGFICRITSNVSDEGICEAVSSTRPAIDVVEINGTCQVSTGTCAVGLVCEPVNKMDQGICTPRKVISPSILGVSWEGMQLMDDGYVGRGEGSFGLQVKGVGVVRINVQLEKTDGTSSSLSLEKWEEKAGGVFHTSVAFPKDFQGIVRVVGFGEGGETVSLPLRVVITQ